jgi:Fic family protein
MRLTYGSNYLSFQSILVREASRKVANTSTTISGDVWDLADMVIHVATGEEKDKDQADSSPHVSVLN